MTEHIPTAGRRIRNQDFFEYTSAVSSSYIVRNVLTATLPLGIVWWFRDAGAVLTAALLILLEVSLSFDNAVLNARVLMRMSPAWQKRFLTWGILIAVVGTRVILPIVIVAVAALISPIVVAQMALFDPAAYGHMLHDVKPLISAFGGMFLLMVAMKYFLNDQKDAHWLHVVESRLARWGHVESLQIGVALTILVLLAFFAPNPTQILIAGLMGVQIFIYLQMLEGFFAAAAASTSGAVLFTYLEVLDASFSLDGVVAAFALTSDILIIMIGLGVGAWFVRSFTIDMVRHNTLHTLAYLEHGAHWAVFALAVAMLAAIFVHVPEVITAGVGIVFILASLYASLNRAKN